jgi:hypothetical protein
MTLRLPAEWEKQKAIWLAWAKYDNWQSDDKYQVTWHLVAAMFVQGQLFGWAKGNEGYLQDHLSEGYNRNPKFRG